MNGNNFNSMMDMTDNTMFATENSMAEITNNLEEYKERLRSLKEVQDLTSEIEVQNPNSIVQFGQKASENISKISHEGADHSPQTAKGRLQGDTPSGSFRRGGGSPAMSAVL